MEVILYIIVGFWLLGLLGRWGLRWWLARRLGTTFGGTPEQAKARAEQKAQRARAEKERAANEAKRREGTVSVQSPAPSDAHTVSREVGEYVEFEECKD